MIVEREEEIEKFISQEYWDLEGQLKLTKKHFTAKLTVYDGNKLEQFSITNEKASGRSQRALFSKRPKAN